ncbi:MAG: hypothetical protein KBS77_07725 [Bacteroidales bacterium]|nr:hypothetical protein [Candidatus Colicola faecequi]
MKKIMFNDKYGLTEAVLEGRKTQTRRVINLTDTDKEYLDTAFDWDLRESVIIGRYAKYKIGEVVAVAQSYKDIVTEAHNRGYREVMMSSRTGRTIFVNEKTKGWNNKMFVRSNMCFHHIRITNIRVERLKFIRDEDCLKEGIHKVNYDTFVVDGINVYDDGKEDGHYLFDTPREAYAVLIDKVSGKGTWESNPWVFVYDFELVD